MGSCSSIESHANVELRFFGKLDLTSYLANRFQGREKESMLEGILDGKNCPRQTQERGIQL